RARGLQRDGARDDRRADHAGAARLWPLRARGLGRREARDAPTRAALAAPAALIALALGAAPAAADWGTYAYSVGRSGNNSAEHVLGPATVGSLQQTWSTYVSG